VITSAFDRDGSDIHIASLVYTPDQNVLEHSNLEHSPLEALEILHQKLAVKVAEKLTGSYRKCAHLSDYATT